MSRSLVWLAAALLAATARAQTNVEQDIAAGDAALLKFDLDAALTAYRSAYKLAPTNHVANWKLSRSLLDKGTLAKDKAEKKKLFTEAEGLARAAVKLNPADAKGHAFLAISVGQMALFEGGKRKVELSKEIRTEALKALELDPNEDLALHTLAIWHREMVGLNWFLRKFAEIFYGEFPPASIETAEKNLRKAVELAPNVVAHRVELGLTLLAAGKKPEAREQFDKALTMPKTWVTDEHYREIAKRTYRRTTDT